MVGSNIKMHMDLIKNEKARNITFKKRKNGLMKKAFELKNLCDVQCLVIVYEKKPNGQLVRSEIYPEEPEKVEQIIDTFVSKSAKVRKLENLAEYFNKQIMQVKKDTAKLRQKNNKARFHSSDDRLNDFSTNQLLDLLKKLNHKIEDVQQRFNKQYVSDEVGSMPPQTALVPINNVDNVNYSQMVALNQYPNSGSMMYLSDMAFTEEQTNNLQPFQYNFYHQSYNNDLNINGMPRQNYNIQTATATSNMPSYNESSTSTRCENRLQYRINDENLAFYNHVPLQTVYPMSASYLFDNGNQFFSRVSEDDEVKHI
ncbi:MADS-box protein defh21-like [Argentina anserina]|uniref:MADS-box protein defh21-like n=1 Tax=Argentina anserina TaxID=57926 RepID=UPI0021766B80|nr:MADS-box protein defh21-like [Potentilla anserina]